ncbi:protein of unknown function [Streptomyces murinus]|uniref:hypothetical protein n=1 Tax=Streptomyces murinus TaxID=33900 RepID=UPI003D6642B1
MVVQEIKPRGLTALVPWDARRRGLGAATSPRVFDGVRLDGETGFFRTGDLGVIHDGELYITGRLKEVLIIRGRNLYPHDLEQTVRSVDPRLATGAARCSPWTPRGQEIKPRGLTEDDYRALAQDIQRTLVREFSIPLPSVVFVGPGRVRKTTSGKIQRSLMKQLFVTSELNSLHEELTDALRAHLKND